MEGGCVRPPNIQYIAVPRGAFRGVLKKVYRLVVDGDSVKYKVLSPRITLRLFTYSLCQKGFVVPTTEAVGERR